MFRTLGHTLLPKAVQHSLRYRLLAFLFASLLILMAVTVGASQKSATHEFDEILNGQMITTGRALFSIIAVELRHGHAPEIPVLLDEFVRLRQAYGDWVGENDTVEVYDNEFYFQLVDPSGSTVFASRLPVVVNSEEATLGLFKLGSAEDQWHLFGLQDPESGYRFYTGQSHVLREELSNEAIKHILWPFLLAMIFILAVIWLGTSYGLKPVSKLKMELDSRSPNRLDPIAEDGKAIELRPLIVALNRLFSRVSQNLATERQFSADVSHELRTPLAGIKANLDAVRIVPELADQEDYLNNIENCVDNAAQITDGLLLLSRVQSTDLESYFDSKSFNIKATVCDEIGKRIDAHPGWEKRISYAKMIEEESFMFKGSQSLVEIAIGNILDNALKYSEESVEIEMHKDANFNTIVTFKDLGPGIPESDLDWVFQRFYRASTVGSVKGFGLGLSLVQQIMKALGGDIQLSNRIPRGLSTTLLFPVQHNTRPVQTSSQTLS